MRRLRSIALAITVLFVAPLQAQQLRPGLLVGRVLDSEGARVGAAVLRATQGARTIIIEADEDGDYRISGLLAGSWTVSVRRLGYRPVAVTIEMPAEGLRRNFALESTVAALDPQLIAARWTGVRGVVGDARRLSPLTGASIRLLGGDAVTGSDSLGNFALPMPGGREVLLRVERSGFDARLVSVRVPIDGYLQIEVPLDTMLREARDLWIYRDLDQRLKFATPRSAQVSREELVATDATSLGAALSAARSVTSRGIVVNRRACVFVNGTAKPGLPIDAIQANDVEFVEAYPPGSDLTRTLALRWPPGAVCGVPDGTIAASRAGARQFAQFISVWLRDP